ncbi:hypothetical protein DCC81_18665 [Chitinophaga parva]|uniref:Glycosyl transferase family 1 domain-containing protein n=1 Tax=Chitinophaga parva TaxID=2169414 RepID=A0A2T7BIZ8_9BACT|nr:glycosyltransferase [Chitinophaga parva]PUZ26248.1 hypothetical protein DCC81_18665 [Chitinophaga parva]
MQVVFWQGIVSPHQSAFLTALAKESGWQIVLMADKAMSDERARMGWQLPDMQGVAVITGPSEVQVQQQFADAQTVHIFSGINYSPVSSKALQLAVRRKARIGIMAEPYDWLGWRGQLRHLRGVWQRMRYNAHVSFILAIGNKGYELFHKAAWPDHKIFEWGYFIVPVEAAVQVEMPPFRILFTGSLITRKGVDLLIHALGRLKNQHFELDIVGQGPVKPLLEQLVEQYQLQDRVRFYDFMDNQEAQQFLASHDLFVLPSRRDGWGAVVNEALMQGTPVICSNHCGASVLINNSNGAVFQSENIEELAALIAMQIDKGKIDMARRNALRSWAGRISGTAAAQYFRELIAHVTNGGKQPVAPWKQ